MIQFKIRDRDHPDYHSKIRKVPWRIIGRRGAMYAMGEGKVELFTIKVMAEALDRSTWCILDWEKSLEKAIDIKIPYQKMQSSFDANKAHLYLFIDGDSITPGPYTYHHEWFRDAAYMVTALDKMGFHEEAERILLRYPGRQKRSDFARMCLCRRRTARPGPMSRRNPSTFPIIGESEETRTHAVNPKPATNTA